MRCSPIRPALVVAFLNFIGCGDPLPPLKLPSACVGDDCGGVVGDGGTPLPASCRDGVLGEGESDIDCGGDTCLKCAYGAACRSNMDCVSDLCDKKLCEGLPKAALTLSTTSGAARLTVSVTSQAEAGSYPIADISYDWDDGQGFEPATTHVYATAGSYLVRQRVIDERGASKIAEVELTVTDPLFRQVRFSPTDKSASVLLSPDRLSVEQRGLDVGGVRSDEAIMPGSGVFYFEVERLKVRPGNWGFGLATAEELLTNEVGHQSQSFGVLTSGALFNNNNSDFELADCSRPPAFPPETLFYGFVVDYRDKAKPPRIHFLIEQAGAAVVQNSCDMGVDTHEAPDGTGPIGPPLYIFYSGTRHEIGYQARINTGADTTNHPFHFPLAKIVSALATASQPLPMASITYGFGGTRALAPSTPPALQAPADQSVAFGASLTLMATASDPEDPMPNLTSKIKWLDVASQHHAPVEGVGGSFSFTPSSIGRHPVQVSVRDSTGLVTSKLVQIEVRGALPQPDPVLLVPDANAGDYVELYPDGLSATFIGQNKYGIRANQGIYRGSYQYFEVHREKAAGNMGAGLVIGEGALNPYHFDDVPWSCSINTSGNTWRNLIARTNWDAANDRYGFAVDYRGEHPIVHVLIGSGKRAKLESSLVLDDVWVPLYPMVYGNPQAGTTIPPEPEEMIGDAGVDAGTAIAVDAGPANKPDLSVNFGASDFHFNPRALIDGGAELQLGWGVHAR